MIKEIILSVDIGIIAIILTESIPEKHI
jgi:hypothetical protein